MFRRRTKRSSQRRRRKRTVDRDLGLQIIPLEPRFVLNASAELSPLGQLLVSGTAEADFVQLQIASNGDLSLRDEFGDPIPIANHPDGPGNETNPLDRADVTEIQFAMDGGEDVLELELPRGIDVSVLPSEGDDQTDLDFTEFNPAQTSPGSIIDVQSELIRIASATGNVAFADAAVRLDGDVFFGNTQFASQIDVTRASLDVDGSFVLEGDVTITGPGLVDLSGSSLSASRLGSGLTVDLGTDASNRFLLGGANDSAGFLIDHLNVQSAGEVVLGPTSVMIDGALTVDQVAGQTLFSGPVEAASVDVQNVGDLEVNDSVITRDGGVTLSATNSLVVSGDIDTTSSVSTSDIELLGSTVQLDESMLQTRGGLVHVEGPTAIQGAVVIETGDAAVDAGDVRFANTVTTFDGQGDTLRVNALSGGVDGLVEFSDRIELNGLEVDGEQIQLDSASITLGDILLRASEIRLTGDQLQTSVAGDIVIDGPLLLPTGNASIVAADRVQFTSAIRGQAGTDELSVTAGSEALFEGQVEAISRLTVDGGQRAQFDDSVSLAGQFDVSADTIQISADVTTAAGAVAGQVQLRGATLVQVENGSTIHAGDAAIQIDGGGGEINTTGSTLQTTAVDSAIVFQNASRLTLGNIVASDGQVVMGVNQDLTGPTTQAIGSTVTIDRLMVSSSASINLSNNGNDLRVIERIESSGEVTVRDEMDDLSVIAIDASTADITLFSAGLISLSERAITTDATVRLEANGRIVDADDNDQINIEASTVNLQAAGIGAVGNALDVSATQAVNADTSSGDGDVFLANLQGELRIGQLDTGTGNVSLQAADIQLNDSLITTSGGSVEFLGPTTIQGAVRIETSDAPAAVGAGDVRFTNSITGFDGQGDTLQIDATSAGLSGVVELGGTIDLNGLTVDARQIELDSVFVTDGDIVLRADEIRLLGDELQTSVTGDVIVDGSLLLPTGDVSITAADRVQFTSSIRGQIGTGTLAVTASEEALFEGQVQDVGQLVVDGGLSARFLDSVSLAGEFDVSAETIQISANVMTNAGPAAGEVRLQAATQVRIDSGATIDSGDAAILIDGGGGEIDTTDSLLRTTAIDSAIVFQNASLLTLGSIEAIAGQVVMGVNQDLTGPTTQAVGSSVFIDRLNVSSIDAIDLSNNGNDVRVIEQIETLGEVTVRDQLSDLAVISINANTADVTLIAAGAISLSQRAITTDATASLEAGGSITDSDDNEVLNIEASEINLQAASIGSVGNALDVSAATELNADTSAAGGDIFLTNLQGDLRAGQLDAGLTATVDLEASGQIVDAVGDAQLNIEAAVINLQAASIGSVDNALDVSASQELNADTSATGGDMFLANLQGDLLVGRLNAGAAATVGLESSGQIVDAIDDTQLNIEAGTVNLQSASIGSVDNALDVSASQELNADTSVDGGDIFLANLQGDLLVGRLNAGNAATVDLEASGKIVDAIDDTQLNIEAGMVNLQAASIGSVDNALDVSASQELNADTSASDGDVFLANLQGDLLVGRLNAGAAATVGLEASGQIVDAIDNTQLNIEAGVINLQAASIGSVDNALDVSASQVLNADTSAADGDIFLANLQGELLVGRLNAGAAATVGLEASGQIVDAIDNTQLNIEAGVINLQATSIGSVGNGLDVSASQELNADTSAAGGDIFLANLQGDLRVGRLNAGAAATVGLEASGQIVDAIDDTQLNIEAGVINLQAASIGSVDNALDVSASQELNADTSASDGDIFLANLQGDLRIGRLNAGATATVRLTASGQIVDANNDAQINVDAGVVNLQAASIGSIDNPLDVFAAQELNADTSAAGGDIFLANLQDDLRVGDLDAGAGSIRLQAATVELNESELTTRGGSVLVEGPTTIQGFVLIQTGDTQAAVDAGDVRFTNTITGFDGQSDTLQIDASSGGLNGLVELLGAIDLNGLTVDGRQIDLESVSVTQGDIVLRADEIRLLGDALQTSVTGDIVVDGTLRLPTGSVSVVAADRVQFTSPIRGQVGTEDLTVTAGSDAVFEGLIEGVRSLSVDAGLLAQFDDSVSLSGDFDIDAETIQINSDVSTTAGVIAGQVRLQGGSQIQIGNDATVDSGDAPILINGGGGEIDTTGSTLRTTATDLAILFQNASQLTIGSLEAGDGQVVMGINRDLTGPTRQAIGSTVTIDRFVASSTEQIDLSNNGNDLRVIEQIDTLGEVTIRDDADDLDVIAINADMANVTLFSVGRMTLSQRAITTDGTVNIEAGDRIVDGDDNAEINIQAGVVNLQATAIGSIDDPLDIFAVEVLNADTSAAGGDAVLANLQGDLLVGQLNAGVGNIHLRASDDVLTSDDQSLVVADDLSVIAQNESSDGIDAISLNTNVNDFQGAVLGVNRGDIRLAEQDSIRLASSDELGDEIVETNNGQIVVVANESIVVSDHSVGDDGPDRKQDPELVARGANGRIDLEVLRPGGFIELDETAQLVAEQKTPDASFDEAVSQTTPPAIDLEREDRAVFLQADSVRFGTQIEIFTGADQGTARVFAPRPLDLEPPGENEPFPDTDQVGDGDSAFFVASSVRTSLLEQAVVNDATGTLSLDIGQTGEKGLTIDIDWGAPNEPGDPGEPERFQRIDGLDADRPTAVDQNGSVVELAATPDARLSVEHLYSEANILDSEVNGRPSSTDPFVVLFSVRHHASILVLASDVQQGDALELDTPGVISSTDDPRTESFENGRANFLIPNLTIPVDFVPVRDVIPVIETTEVIVRTESNIEFVQPNLETTEFSITPIVVRDEYFQIRALNADPTGEDLAVQRLPNDILSGDKIRNLLSRLPDGSYEIEYVLGDTTRRTILRVEIRDGQATIPSETLDEGVLRLREIYADEPSDLENNATEELKAEGDATDDAESSDNEPKDADALPLPAELGDVEPDNLGAETLPGPDDQTLLPRSSYLLPLIGISTLTATGYRRGKRSRFSRASAFAKRWEASEDHA